MRFVLLSVSVDISSCFVHARDGVWYEKRPLGKNKLGCMMSEISKISKLSKKYTNHCIRATAITALDQARFAPRHIMSVSGHRSEVSIKNYSRKTSTDQKRKMSETLGKLIPLSSGCTTIDENEADNLKKKTHLINNKNNITKTSLILVEIYIAVFENIRRFFIPCTVNYIVNFFLDNSTALVSVLNFRDICNVLKNQFCFGCCHVQ
jgi:hypothetical protein